MRLYLDTADVSEWQRLMSTGMFHGITTNPLLAQRAGLQYPSIDWAAMVMQARDLGAQEFHAQVYGPPDSYAAFAAALYAAGRDAGIATVVKIPMVEPALRQVPAIKALGGPILLTAVYSAAQMLVASAMQAAYIAPYFGRMLESGADAYGALADMQAVAAQPEVNTKVLVASLRDADQMVKLARQGHDTFTIAPVIADALLANDQTQAAYVAFEEAAKP